MKWLYLRNRFRSIVLSIQVSQNIAEYYISDIAEERKTIPPKMKQIEGLI